MTAERRDRIAAGGPGSARASDADREQTIDMLNEAFADGRLTTQEHGVRIGRALGAQTCADLTAVSADLPAWPPGPSPSPVPRGRASRPSVGRTNRLAIAALVCCLIPGLPQLAAVVLGIEAARQIRRSGERGLPLALARAALGMLGLMVAALLVLR